MSWALFEDDHDGGVLTGWSLQKVQRAKLEQRLDMLRSVGLELPPNLVAGPGIEGEKHIYKFKVKGNVQLRPMLCRGPHDPRSELTFLARATEKDGKLLPSGIASNAEAIRLSLIEGLRNRVLIDD